MCIRPTNVLTCIGYKNDRNLAFTAHRSIDAARVTEIGFCRIHLRWHTAEETTGRAASCGVMRRFWAVRNSSSAMSEPAEVNILRRRLL